MGRTCNRSGIKSIVVPVLVLAVILFSAQGCNFGTYLDNDNLLPSAAPSDRESPSIVVPSGAPTIDIFGLAFSSAGDLNPITCSSRLNMYLIPLMYEALFEIGGDFEAHPVLCERFEKDDSSYTFYLNTEAKFSDGTALTAQDVKYSLDLARGSDTFYSGRFRYVKSIAAVGDTAVKIELSEQIGHLELLLDIPIIKSGSANMVSPTGTGPYTYIEDGDESYLKAYSGWWQKEPRPFTRIDLIDTPEADLLISFFESGAISMAGNDPTATDPVVFGGDYEEWSFPTGIMYYLGINTEDGPMRSANLRKALNHAVDREFICEIEMLRYADQSALPVNPGSRLYDADIADDLSFSLEKFAQQMAADGYGEDKPLAIKMIVNSENEYKVAVAERIAEDMRSMGVTVELEYLKWSDYLVALTNQNFDVYLAEVRLRNDFDLTELVSQEGTLNFGRYYSEETELLLASFRTADADSLKAAAEALYKKLSEDAPIIPVLFKRHVVNAKRGIVDSIEPTQTNIFNGLKN